MTILKRLENRLKYQVLKLKDVNSEKVFGIGLSKTGTTSLSSALNLLGFKSLHTPPIINLKNNEINFQWPWWLSTYDALTDLPVPYFYKYFDENYPNAKFILTVRNEKDWLKSCANHFDEDLNLLLERPEPHFKALLALCEKMYGSLLYDEKLYREAFIQHNLAVEEYFKGRDNFLVLDVCAGDPWPELCSFLGVPKPTVEFPHGNATKKL